MLKKVGWDVDTVFNTWASSLSKRHLLAARNLLVDDSIFDDQLMHPHWPADQLDRRYVAETAGINLNANCLDFYVDPAGAGGGGAGQFPHQSLHRLRHHQKYLRRRRRKFGLAFARSGRQSHHPSRAGVFIEHCPGLGDHPRSADVCRDGFSQKSCKKNGVAFSGIVKRDRTQREAYEKALASGDKSWLLLAVHETPLTSVISRANKDSMNHYAECVSQTPWLCDQRHRIRGRQAPRRLPNSSPPSTSPADQFTPRRRLRPLQAERHLAPARW